MSELKACPFCGTQPVVQPWHGGGPNKILIGCENDEGCVVQPSVADDDPEVARAMWNGRAVGDSCAPTFDNIIVDLRVLAERVNVLRVNITRRNPVTRRLRSALRMAKEKPFNSSSPFWDKLIAALEAAYADTREEDS